MEQLFATSKCNFPVAKRNYGWRVHPPFPTLVGRDPFFEDPILFPTLVGHVPSFEDPILFPTLVGVIRKRPS